MDLIPVLPKHYRAIVLEVRAAFPEATAWVDGGRCDDFSEAGPLTQRKIAQLRDFEMRTGGTPILGFHDHPREMWVNSDFGDLAEQLAALGHLTMER